METTSPLNQYEIELRQFLPDVDPKDSIELKKSSQHNPFWDGKKEVKKIVKAGIVVGEVETCPNAEYFLLYKKIPCNPIATYAICAKLIASSVKEAIDLVLTTVGANENIDYADIREIDLEKEKIIDPEKTMDPKKIKEEIATHYLWRKGFLTEDTKNGPLKSISLKEPFYQEFQKRLQKI